MAKQQCGRKWSGNVTETSDALDLEEDLQVAQRETHSRFMEVLRRAQPSTQIQSIPVCNVDAELLH